MWRNHWIYDVQYWKVANCIEKWWICDRPAVLLNYAMNLIKTYIYQKLLKCTNSYLLVADSYIGHLPTTIYGSQHFSKS